MKTHATGTFEIKSWDEKPVYEAEDQPKLAHASIVTTFHGDIEGEGILEYQLCYSNNAIAYYCGYERITGRIGNRSGSFVLYHQGRYEDGKPYTTWSVVPGSGTGELQGLQGEGGYSASTSFTLDYDFA